MYRFTMNKECDTIYCILTKTFKNYYGSTKEITTVGKSKCSPEDTFDFKIGEKIAYKRALIKYLKIVRSNYEETLKVHDFNSLTKLALKLDNICLTIDNQCKELSKII